MDGRRPVIVLLMPSESETWELLVDESLGVSRFSSSVG